MAGPGFASGFEEEKGADYKVPYDLVGQWRRFGDYGVAYEVKNIGNDKEATIEVFGTHEVLTYPIAKILADPIAECLP